MTHKILGSIVLTPAGAPASPTNGQIYVDNSTNYLYVYDGSGWRRIINLDSTGKLPVADGSQLTNLAITPYDQAYMFVNAPMTALQCSCFCCWDNIFQTVTRCITDTTPYYITTTCQYQFLCSAGYASAYYCSNKESIWTSVCSASCLATYACATSFVDLVPCYFDNSPKEFYVLFNLRQTTNGTSAQISLWVCNATHSWCCIKGISGNGTIVFKDLFRVEIFCSKVRIEQITHGSRCNFDVMYPCASVRVCLCTTAAGSSVSCMAYAEATIVPNQPSEVQTYSVPTYACIV